MMIEFLKPYGCYVPGAVTEAVPPGVCDVLIRRRIAREVVAAVLPPESPKTTTKVVRRGKTGPAVGG